jgi:hypothetical protein
LHLQTAYVLLAPPLLQFSQNRRYRQYITPRFRIQPHSCTETPPKRSTGRNIPSSRELGWGQHHSDCASGSFIVVVPHWSDPTVGLKCRFHCSSRNSTSSRYEAYFGHRFLAEITSPSFSLNKNMPETIYLSSIDGSPGQIFDISFKYRRLARSRRHSINLSRIQRLARSRAFPLLIEAAGEWKRESPVFCGAPNL